MSSYVQEIQADTPNTWWRFRETSLTFLDEVAGRELKKPTSDTEASPIVITDTPIFNDRSSRSCYFDGSSSRLFNGTFHPGYDSTLTYSWSFWIRPDDLTINAQHFFNIGIGSAGDNWIAFHFLSSGKVVAGTTTSTGSFGASIDLDQGVFQQGQWHHVVFTLEPSSGGNHLGKLYVNKVLVGTGFANNLIVTGNDFYVNNFSGFSNQNCQGALTELIAFPVTLSQQRVNAHYDAAVAPPPDTPPDQTYHDLILSKNPLLFYEFNEMDASSIVKDESPNHFDGQYVGNISFQQSPIVADSQRSIYLNGGYINIPVAPLRNLTVMTVEIWIRTLADIGTDNRIWDFNNGIVNSSDSKYIYQAWNYQGTETIGTEFSIAGSGTKVIAFSRRVIANEPIHVALTFHPDATDPNQYNAASYINGVRSGVTPLQTYNLSAILAGALNGWIGKSPFGSATNYKGIIDEFAIYDHVLSEASILENYEKGVTAAPPPVIIKPASYSESIVFTESFDIQKIPPGSGRVFNMSISDTLNFSESTGGGPPPTAISDTLNFTDSVQGEARPFHLENKDQLVFIETLHVSPFRATFSDTLQFVELFRPNLFKADFSDKLTFQQTMTHNWKLETVKDSLVFSELMTVQNNHQYLNDLLVFDEQLDAHKSITNTAISDQLTFIESQNLRYSIANLTVSDALVFQDEFHRVLFGTISDTLVFTQSTNRVQPATINDLLVFVETMDAQASKYFSDKLVFFEVFCVQSNLSRGLSDTLGFIESFSFLINGPDDPRNGGGAPGGGGIVINAVYRKTMNDRLVFKETIITDPAPSGQDCVVDVSSESNTTFIENMIFDSDDGVSLRFVLRFSGEVHINSLPLNIKIKRLKTGILVSPINMEFDDPDDLHKVTLVYPSSFEPSTAVANEWIITGAVPQITESILFPQTGRIENVPTYVMSVHDTDGTNTVWTFSSRVLSVGLAETGTFQIYDDISATWFDVDGGAALVSENSITMTNNANRPLSGWRIVDASSIILFETGLIAPQEGSVT